MTPGTAECQASLSITNTQSLLKLISIESVMPFNHLFPASGSFPMSQLFTSGGHSIRVSASTSILPMNIQDLLDGLVGSPCSPRDSQKSSPTPQFKSINFSAQPSLWSNSYISSVQFSGSVMSDSSRPHESQHARPPCPSPTPRLHSDSRPSSQ